MSDSDNRHISRDSLFILAELRLQGERTTHKVKVRNLSGSGLMGEGDVPVTRGDAIEINLRHIGWVSGHVAWMQGTRFGMAFAQEIDDKPVRAPLSSDHDPNEQFRRKLMSGVVNVSTGPVRKVI